MGNLSSCCSSPALTPTPSVPEAAEIWGQEDEDCLSSGNNRITKGKDSGTSKQRNKDREEKEVRLQWEERTTLKPGGSLRPK